jgi:hypothetical protein
MSVSQIDVNLGYTRVEESGGSKREASGGGDEELSEEEEVPSGLKFSKGKKSLKAKTWFLTYPNLPEGHFGLPDAVAAASKVLAEAAQVAKSFDTGLEWGVSCVESHRNGVPHFHVVLKFDSPIRVSDPHWADSIGGKHGNYQTVRNVRATVGYVIKEGTWQAIGIRPKEYVADAKRKRGSAFNAAVDLILKGRSLREVADVEPYAAARNLRQLREFEQFLRAGKLSWRVSDGRVRVVVLWGDTGVGKSHWAFGSDGDGGVFCPPDPASSRRIWFTGYTRERTVIFDDVDFTFISINTLLGLLDVYERPLLVHGGVTRPEYSRVIITNNHPLEYFFPKATQKHLKALKRRITSVYCASRNTLYDGGDITKPYCFDCVYERGPIYKPALASSKNLVS